jgi:hypothetical protein
MELRKPVMKITTDEWQSKQRRGLAAMINDRPYIVTMHAATQEPIYHPVEFLDQPE